MEKKQHKQITHVPLDDHVKSLWNESLEFQFEMTTERARENEDWL